MQSTEKNPVRLAAFLIAIACSLTLTYITITTPLIPTDWARLDAAGVYVPVRVNYAWPGYAVQIGLWVVIVGALVAISSQRSAVSKIQKQRQDFHHGPTRRLRTGTDDAEIKSKKTVSVIWILASITLVGFGIRLHTLGALPLIIDEIGFAAHASDILHGQQVPIFAPYRGDSVTVYSWMLAGFMALFGQNPFAIRLLSLVLGTLSIPALYVLGREWWSRRVGLLVAAFLATYPAHIFFSRLSLFNIADPLFATLTLALLARAIQRPSFQRYWILAGLMAGISQYFYQSSRLLLVLMAVYIVLSAVSGQRSAEKKWKLRTGNWKLLANLASWRFNILWMLLAFSIVVLPRFAPMLVNRQPLTVNEEALELPADFGANSLRALLGWVGQPDVSPFWLSDAPLLEWAALLLFAPGVLVSLWRWRDPRFAVPLLSILLTTYFGGMIRTAAPLYVRYVTAVPAIALLVAVGLSAKDKIFTTAAQRKNAKTRYGMFLQATVILLMAAQGIYAAVRQPDEALARISQSQWIEQDLARQAAELPPETAAVLVVPADFNEVQRITITHYVAAYGERRVVVINQMDNAVLAEQLSRLNGLPYTILRPR